MASKTLMFMLAIFVFFTLSASALQPAPDEENQIVAVVSGHPVTEKQVLAIMKYTVFQEEDELPRELLAKMPQGLFNQAIDIMVMRTLLLEKARQQKIRISEAHLEDRLRQLSDKYPSYAEYVEKLKSYGIDEAELRNHGEETLKIQQVIDHAVKDTPKGTEEEIEKFYAGRSGRILTSEKVRASHIMLRIDPQASDRQKKIIRERLEKIKAEIEAGKITFTEAAKKYSQDAETATLGGDLGVILRGQKEKTLETAVFNTPPGNVAPIVESKHRYHLVRVDELKTPHQAGLEETKDLAMQYYNQRSRRLAADKFLAEIKAGAKIEMLMTPQEFVERNSDVWASLFQKQNP